MRRQRDVPVVKKNNPETPMGVAVVTNNEDGTIDISMRITDDEFNEFAKSGTFEWLSLDAKRRKKSRY